MTYKVKYTVGAAECHQLLLNQTMYDTVVNHQTKKRHGMAARSGRGNHPALGATKASGLFRTLPRFFDSIEGGGAGQLSHLDNPIHSGTRTPHEMLASIAKVLRADIACRGNTCEHLRSLHHLCRVGEAPPVHPAHRRLGQVLDLGRGHPRSGHKLARLSLFFEPTDGPGQALLGNVPVQPSRGPPAHSSVARFTGQHV